MSIRSRTTSRRRSAATVGAALTLLGAGCVQRSEYTQPLPVLASSQSVISPVVLGARNGLELRWWVARDDQGAIERVVEPYLDQPLPIDATTEDRLRRSGLRLVAIPAADLFGLRARLPIVGRIDRRWIGQAPAWTQAVAGLRFDGELTVRMAGELISLPAGELRLLTRAWTAPGPTGPSLRIDLAIQHVSAARLNPRRALLDLTGPRPAASDGMLFDSTMAQLTADGRFVYLLVPERPETRWSQKEDQSEKRDDRGDAPTEAQEVGAVEPLPWSPESAPTGEQVEGPPAARIPTIGEAMLISADNPIGEGRLRAIIVLIPRLPAEQFLLR